MSSARRSRHLTKSIVSPLQFVSTFYQHHTGNTTFSEWTKTVVLCVSVSLDVELGLSEQVVEHGVLLVYLPAVLTRRHHGVVEDGLQQREDEHEHDEAHRHYVERTCSHNAFLCGFTLSVHMHTHRHTHTHRVSSITQTAVLCTCTEFF